MDKNEIVNLYITRDEKLNINNNSSIIFNLKKLGYYNFDFQKLRNTFIRSVYINEIKNNKDIFKKSYLEWEQNFTNTKEYINFDKDLNFKLLRSILLSKHTISNNTSNFYKDCTIEELSYIGY